VDFENFKFDYDLIINTISQLKTTTIKNLAGRLDDKNKTAK